MLIIKKNISPVLAWDKAVTVEFPDSISSQKKSCPKNAFLGLCEEGLIEGINSGDYTQSDLNKKYSITAIKILASHKNKTFSPPELWKAVLKKLNADHEKQHNSQMNVVLALWNEGLIKI
jgi:hypothetical protein